ncbi:hypothetical protein ABTH17_18900, partial [Acinetobacter baumannii]
APYGNPSLTNKMHDLLKWTDDGLFRLDLSFFRSPSKGFVYYDEEAHLPLVPSLFGEKMIELFGQPRAKEEPLTQYHKDLAASVQRFTEETIFHILN